MRGASARMTVGASRHLPRGDLRVELPQPGAVLPHDLFHIGARDRTDAKLVSNFTEAEKHPGSHVGVRILRAVHHPLIAAKLADLFDRSESCLGSEPAPIGEIDVEVLP